MRRFSVLVGAGAVVVGLSAIVILALLREPSPRPLIVAVTTTTYDSGLLDQLVPEFQRQTGFTVKVIAMGTGQALATAARGEADVVLTHAPELEAEYVADGALVRRQRVMSNDFLIVGPAEDPAGIRAVTSPTSAFRQIAEKEAPFVSRGDNSGTHILEKKLWQGSGEPTGAWYMETGQGMGATLLIASTKGAYTLTDRSTYLAFSEKLALEPLVESDPLLVNVYHVMEVNSERFPLVNGPGAREFAEFLVGTKAQAIIGSFGVDRFGMPLFVPDAVE